MTINEIEKLTGLTKKSIRYYEQEGLVLPQRLENDYRNYSEEDLNKLKRIKIYRFLGFSVLEIKEIFENNISIHMLLQQKADSIEEESESLKEKQEICLKSMLTIAEFIFSCSTNCSANPKSV